MHDPRFALFLYRLLLRLYPAQFREEYEREVLFIFRREWSGRSGRVAAPSWYFITVATAVLRDAPREHVDVLMSDLRDALHRSLCSTSFTIVAIATLTGSWLLIRSFEQMRQVSPSYDARDFSKLPRGNSPRGDDRPLGPPSMVWLH